MARYDLATSAVTEEEEDAADGGADEATEDKPAFGGKITTIAHVRNAVAAHGKVPDNLKEAAKAKILKAARGIPGSMAHIPPAWVKK